MASSFINNEENYEKSVKDYKIKYKNCRLHVSRSVVCDVLDKCGYTTFYSKMKLVSISSSELKDVVEKIMRKIPVYGVGKGSNALYMAILCEMLDMVDIPYQLYVGFVLPQEIKNKEKYEGVSIANYMFVTNLNSALNYHYFNGKIDSSDFTFFRKDKVEV